MKVLLSIFNKASIVIQNVQQKAIKQSKKILERNKKEQVPKEWEKYLMMSENSMNSDKKQTIMVCTISKRI